MRAALAFAIVLVASPALSQAPATPVAPAAGEGVITTVRAEGVQVYDCRANAAGALSWAFREPIAPLLRDGRTIGRHYAGPHWEFDDGSLVRGAVARRAPGAGPADIPHLRLDVVARRDLGELSPAVAILRVRTVGGVLEGPCERAGELRSVVYSSDYVFLRR